MWGHRDEEYFEQGWGMRIDDRQLPKRAIFGRLTAGSGRDGEARRTSRLPAWSLTTPERMEAHRTRRPGLGRNNRRYEGLEFYGRAGKGERRSYNPHGEECLLNKLTMLPRHWYLLEPINLMTVASWSSWKPREPRMDTKEFIWCYSITNAFMGLLAGPVIESI